MLVRLITAMLLVVSCVWASDWSDEVRACALKNDLKCARTLVETRLREHADDLEALKWRGRLLAWSGEWLQADQQYRAVLTKAPHDYVVLLCLADVQLWRGDLSGALDTLDQAERYGAAANDVLLRRARVFGALHRNQEAIGVYEALLAIDPGNSTVRGEIAVLRATEGRHELRIGTDVDTFNYTDTASTETISLASRWNRRWASRLAGNFYQRFGTNAQKINVGATYRINRRDWLSVGGGVANRQGVVAQEELNLEYGHGLAVHTRFVRGMEVYAEHRNFWYSTSHVVTFGGMAVVYLPHDWMWSVSTTAVRTRFTNVGSSFTPSGFTRLVFPLYKRLGANLMYGAGAENFASVDQIGRFAARTMGGGLRCQIRPGQDVSGYVAVQDRSQGRSQVSAGVSYGFRF